MNKERYLETRKRLGEGQVGADELALFYDYYLIKKEEAPIDFDKFAASFPDYLNYGFNYNKSVQRVVSYFDDLYEVQTVLGKKGEVLAIR